jgi:hypothetical protein
MSIVREMKNIIVDLPADQASMLTHWLNQFEAARRYKKLKSYAMTVRILADFAKAGGSASSN